MRVLPKTFAPVVVKSPTTVDDACETKPLVSVARPVCVSVPVCVVLPSTESEPSVASCVKRFVEDAVVANVFVDVEFVIVALVPARVVMVPEFEVSVPIAPV